MLPVDTATAGGIIVVGIFSGAVLVDIVVRFLSWRSNHRRMRGLELALEEVRLEVSRMRSELALRLPEPPPIDSVPAHSSAGLRVTFAPNLPLQRVTSSSTTTSGDVYFDVDDAWPNDEEMLQGGFHEDEMPLLQASSSSNSAAKNNPVNFNLIDKLHESGNVEDAYTQLKAAYDGGQTSDIEVLWRLARECHSRASALEMKNPRRKEILLEGKKYAEEAYKINPEDFYVLKLNAVVVGALTDYLPTKEKIHQGYFFKELLDKAIKIKTDHGLLHMRGRFSYSVASLSWIERKVASTLYATPPSATYDEALTDFLEAEKIDPKKWIENSMYIARCYVALKDYPKACKHLREVLSFEVKDPSDQEFHTEAAALLKKYAK